MPRSVPKRGNTSEDRGRSTKLRPGRVRPTNTSPRRVTGTARNLLRLARLVSRSSSRSSRGGNVKGSGIGSSKTSPFQRRAIVNVRYSNAKTPGGWKAHGTYVERESAKGRDVDDGKQWRWKRRTSTKPGPFGLSQGALAGFSGRPLAESRGPAHFQSHHFPGRFGRRFSAHGKRHDRSHRATHRRSGRMGRSCPPEHRSPARAPDRAGQAPVRGTPATPTNAYPQGPS